MGYSEESLDFEIPPLGIEDVILYPSFGVEIMMFLDGRSLTRLAMSAPEFRVIYTKDYWEKLKGRVEQSKRQERLSREEIFVLDSSSTSSEHREARRVHNRHTYPKRQLRYMMTRTRQQNGSTTETTEGLSTEQVVNSIAGNVYGFGPSPQQQQDESARETEGTTQAPNRRSGRAGSSSANPGGQRMQRNRPGNPPPPVEEPEAQPDINSESPRTSITPANVSDLSRIGW